MSSHILLYITIAYLMKLIESVLLPIGVIAWPDTWIPQATRVHRLPLTKSRPQLVLMG